MSLKTKRSKNKKIHEKKRETKVYTFFQKKAKTKRKIMRKISPQGKESFAKKEVISKERS